MTSLHHISFAQRVRGDAGLSVQRGRGEVSGMILLGRLFATVLAHLNNHSPILTTNLQASLKNSLKLGDLPVKDLHHEKLAFCPR